MRLRAGRRGAWRAELTGIANPVPVSLVIGNGGGTVDVPAEIEP